MSLSSLLLRPRRSRFVNEARGWLGIDIGTTTVKLAEVTRRRDSWTLTLSHLLSTGSVPLTSDRLRAGGLHQLLSTNLNRLAPPTSHDAACVLSAGLSSLSTMDLDAASPAEATLMIQTALETSHTEPMEFGSFENLGQSTGTQINHTVVSLSTAVATAIVDDLWQSGYSCQTIDGLPCLHARAALLSDPSIAHDTVALLDWGSTAPVVTMISHGRPTFSRPLKDCGIGRPMQVTAERLGLAMDELHELLMASSLSLGSSSLLQGAQALLGDLTERCVRLIDPELHRTLRFMVRSGKDHAPSRIILTGGAGLLPLIHEKLSDAMHLPVELWALPDPSGPGANARPNLIHSLFANAIAASTLGVDP